jgi:plastocyanin
MRKLLVGLIAFALGLGAAVLIASPGAHARSLLAGTLTGSVGSSGNHDAYVISLSASTVVAGTYQFNITDYSQIHNFDLCKGTSCTGSNSVDMTSISGTGSVSWTVTLTPGTYYFQCDAHGSIMHGTLTVTSGTTSTTTTTTPPPPPPPVDHQLCYAAAGTFKVPTGVRLVNQFSPNGFVPKISATATFHCNPVIKTVPTGVFKKTNPAAHLACLPITPPTPLPTHKVVVTNQFGHATLTTSQPNLLCLPSWTGTTSALNKQPTTPPGLNHFTCYPVALVAGGGSYKIPTSVKLRDQFAATTVKVTVNPVPKELCLPTQKIVGAKTYPMINPAMHLLCFPVSLTPHKTPVWDENQFGTAKMTIKATKLLCLPSTKQVLS